MPGEKMHVHPRSTLKHQKTKVGGLICKNRAKPGTVTNIFMGISYVLLDVI